MLTKTRARDSRYIRPGTRFKRLIVDAPTIDTPGDATRVLLCSGRIWIDLLAAREALGEAGRSIAILRLEQIAPFPYDLLASVCALLLGWTQTLHTEVAMAPAERSGLDSRMIRRSGASRERSCYGCRRSRSMPERGVTSARESTWSQRAPTIGRRPTGPPRGGLPMRRFPRVRALMLTRRRLALCVTLGGGQVRLQLQGCASYTCLSSTTCCARPCKAESSEGTSKLNPHFFSCSVILGILHDMTSGVDALLCMYGCR